jgi:UDP-N-acetylmuramoyl-tripeptide--D-alanyl-D-alanine ligase
LLCSLAPGRVVAVSMKADADYRCLQRNAVTNEAVVREKASGEEFRFRLPVPGEHNIVNALMAIAVARGHGVGWEGIRKALDAHAPLPMRWEAQSIDGVKVINDAYNANPMSMRMAVRTFIETEGTSPRWLVLGGMLELGAIEHDEHVRLGEFLGNGGWAGLIAVGRLGGVIADGAEKAGLDRGKIFRCRSAKDAADVVRANVKAGDAVLLKASRGVHLEDVLKPWRQEVEQRRLAGAA